MSTTSTNEPVDHDAHLPAFIAEMEEDPWLEIKWKRGLVRKMRDFARDSGGEDSRRRGGRFAYQLSNRQRIGNAIGAPQAMVKIVRNGGAGSSSDLISQLSYLSREGELTLDEHGPDGDFFVRGRDEIKGLAHAWGESWDTAARYDGRSARAGSQTYHIVVSFPAGIEAEPARDAVDQFADRFLNSGEFGDTWRHIRAWHTDTDHPHMHLVVDRRGSSGRMMQIHPAKDINPQRLRSLQVETASEFGILLNDTPRASRGLSSPALSTEGWRAQDGGKCIERSKHRQAYADLTAGFAHDIVPHEAQSLEMLGGQVRAHAKSLPASSDDPHHRTMNRFAASLAAASRTLQSQKEILILPANTRTNDPVTIETLQRMSPEELSSTMRSAVKDAQKLAPGIVDEEQRAALEAVTGRIRQLFAQTIPEFRPAIDQHDRSDGLEPIVRSRGSADETREKAAATTAQRLQRDGDELETVQYDDGPTVPRDPAKTLDQADARIAEAYALRGLNGERALARIKSGLEATAETRNHWHEAEVTERMAAGDVPRGVAEKEITELHTYAAKTYRASERAIQRGVSLDATEVYAPEDPVISRRREERGRLGYSVRTRAPERERDARADDLQIEPPKAFADDLAETPDEERSEPSTPRNGSAQETRPPSREQEDAPGNRLTEEELRQVLNARERELTEAQKQRDVERGIDRNNAQDRGLGLAD